MAEEVPDAPVPDPSAAFENERKMMAAYVDTAKTYSQLSLGALVLSITFVEKIVGGKVADQQNAWLMAAWVSWLLATLAGAFYQYLAARFLELRGEHWGALVRSGHPKSFPWLAQHPWPAYAVMLVAFGIGSIAFAVFGLQALVAR